MSYERAPLTTLSFPGNKLELVGPDYDADNDTVAFTLHSTDWSASVRYVLVGPEEQRRALIALSHIAAALRRKLGSPEAA